MYPVFKFTVCLGFVLTMFIYWAKMYLCCPSWFLLLSAREDFHPWEAEGSSAVAAAKGPCCSVERRKLGTRCSGQHQNAVVEPKAESFQPWKSCFELWAILVVASCIAACHLFSEQFCISLIVFCINRWVLSSKRCMLLALNHSVSKQVSYSCIK